MAGNPLCRDCPPDIGSVHVGVVPQPYSNSDFTAPQLESSVGTMLSWE
jgi:hypothetical protein